MPTISSGCDLMMGFGKTQLHAKFEVAGFIYNGNIREFVLKNWYKPKLGTPYFGEKLTLPLDLHTHCFLFNLQLLWRYDCRKWVLFTKNCILQQKILHFVRLGSGC